jgi:hypothetical protein
MTTWVDALPWWGQVLFGLSVAAVAGAIGGLIGFALAVVAWRSGRLEEYR